MSRIGYNRDGRKLGTILPENEKKRRKDVYIKVVTCFVVDKTTGDVLLEKRTGKGLNPNEYDLVSGHLEGDEIGFHAMIRELSEEVGIGIDESSCGLKKIQEFTPVKFEVIGNYLVEFYCLLRKNKEGLRLQEEEVNNIEWKEMNEVFRMLQAGETKFPKDFNYEEIFQKVRQMYQGKNEQQASRE